MRYFNNFLNDKKTGEEMELEAITLREINHTEKDKYCVFSLRGGI